MEISLLIPWPYCSITWADCDEDSSEDEDEDVKVDAPKAKGECNPWTQKTPPVMSSSSEEEVEQRTDKKRGLEDTEEQDGSSQDEAVPAVPKRMKQHPMYKESSHNL